MIEGIIAGCIVLFLGWVAKKSWQYLPGIWTFAHPKQRVGIVVSMIVVMGVLVWLALFGYNYSQQSTQISQPTIPLTIEGVHDPFTIVPQEKKQALPPKVSKYAVLKVINHNQIRINNVSVVVTKADDRPKQFRLGVSSIYTLFDKVDYPPPKVTVDLNPNDEEYFDAVIECNGLTCPKGKLMIPYIDAGQRMVMSPVHENIERLDDFTVRASGDGVSATIKTFRVRMHGDGYLVLEPKKE